jgi:predicted transcriptional regulator
MKDIHIGSIIKQKLAESSMTIKEFSNRINCDRTTVYDILKRKSIDIDRLIQISRVLNYDFINEVYYKKETLVVSPPTIFIAIEIDENALQKLNLPDNIIRLIKKT